MTEAPDWRNDALCAQIPDADPIFFTDNPNGRSAAAHAICGHCTVAKECLDDALAIEGNSDRSRRYGIRGGTTPAQRARMSRAARKEAS